MNTAPAALLLSDIRAPFDAPDGEILQIASTKMKRACISVAGLHFRIYKTSFDARRKQNILRVCSVLVEPKEGESLPALDEARLHAIGARPFIAARPEIARGKEPLSARPLVVGMGPAGLFAALLLAEQGYRPILIDRGDDVETRAAKTERFRATGALDPESNVQFGAGGAGTFSDGKLVTRVNDPLCNYVLDRLCEFGAPAEIAVKAKPHVGTDLLRLVVANLLSRVESLGGTVRYRTCLKDLAPCLQGVKVSTNAGDLAAGALLLGIPNLRNMN